MTYKSTSERKFSIVEPSPEQRLRADFAEEDALLNQLARVRERQRKNRNDYATAHGLLVRPSLEQLRKVLGGG